MHLMMANLIKQTTGFVDHSGRFCHSFASTDCQYPHCLASGKMNLEELRQIALSLPAVTEDIKWEDHLCFCIAGKIFMITGLDHFPVGATFKVNEEDFDRLCRMEGFTAARYLAKHKWISLDNIERLGKEEWEEILYRAYWIIREKLPARIKNSLVK
jgi:predicted DNA-binding protein (MmcQ/YjbR family)